MKRLSTVEYGGLKLEHFESEDGRRFLSLNGSEPTELNNNRISGLYGFISEIFDDYEHDRVKTINENLSNAKNTKLISNETIINILKEEIEKFKAERNNG